MPPPHRLPRPVFLVVDPAYPGALSTRKLVIETAMFNVLTAYSAEEAIETLRLFPNLHAVVMDARVDEVHCSDLVSKMREIVPKVPIIITSGRGYDDCGPVDYHLDTYDPKTLLDLLRKMFPSESAEVMRRDETPQ
jgi:DNA-binding NtrC family response regulator